MFLSNGVNAEITVIHHTKVNFMALVLLLALIASLIIYGGDVEALVQKSIAHMPRIREVTPEFVFFDVPFTSQAPLEKWWDSRFQNGCEEAAVLMAVAWANGVKDLKSVEVEREIVSLVDFEKKLFGFSDDTSTRDTARLAEAYFGYKKLRVRQNIHASDIREELQRKNLVIVPVDGQKLNNPFYTPPGPARHMLVIVGYDPWDKEFIVHDPGTRRGRNMRYGEEIIENALRDYPSGSHSSIKVGSRTNESTKDNRKNMIVVEQHD